MRVRDTLRLGLPIALILAACSAAAPSASPTGVPTPGASTPPSATPGASPSASQSAALVLRVTTEGGFSPARTAARTSEAGEESACKVTDGERSRK